MDKLHKPLFQNLYGPETENPTFECIEKALKDARKLFDVKQKEMKISTATML